MSAPVQAPALDLLAAKAEAEARGLRAVVYDEPGDELGPWLRVTPMDRGQSSLCLWERPSPGPLLSVHGFDGLVEAAAEWERIVAPVIAAARGTR